MISIFTTLGLGPLAPRLLYYGALGPIVMLTVRPGGLTV